MSRQLPYGKEEVKKRAVKWPHLGNKQKRIGQPNKQTPQQDGVFARKGEGKSKQ